MCVCVVVVVVVIVVVADTMFSIQKFQYKRDGKSYISKITSKSQGTRT